MKLRTQDELIDSGRNLAFRLAWWFVAILILLITAINSAGPLHPDEYYQILEPASYWLGLTEIKQLPYEFGLQIRPWFQPFFAMVPMALGEWFGLTRAHTYALIRFSFALFVLGGVAFFVGSSGALSPQARELAKRYYFLVFFVPYLAVRTSSESFCLSLCLMALGFHGLFWRKRTHFYALLVGFFFGLSFVVRAQAVAFFIGYLFWLTFVARSIVNKDGLRSLASIGSGFVAAIGLGIVLDRIGYGTWVLTLVNYFNFNIVQGGAAKFGTEPWYFLIAEFAHTSLLKPLELIAIVAIFCFLMVKRRNLLTSLFLAFLVFNSLPAHKESRFIFPLFFFIPFFLFELWQLPWVQRLKHKRWLRVVVASVVVANAVFLLKRSLEAIRIQVLLAEEIEEMPAGPVCIESREKVPVYDYTNLTMQFLKGTDRHSLTYSDRCLTRPSLVIVDGAGKQHPSACHLSYAKPWWRELLLDLNIDMTVAARAPGAVQIWSCPP